MSHFRPTWPDNLRVIATIAMVLVHVVSPVLYQFGKVDWFTWHLANTIDSSARFCVPIFVMLSGALLLPTEIPVAKFFRKRLLRVVLPFLFWSCIYIAYNLNNRMRFSFEEAADYTRESLLKGASYHLWYIYMIIGVYLFIPIIGKWVRACSDNEIRYFLFIWLITLFLNLPWLAEYEPVFELMYFSGFVGFLILGYYLGRRKISPPFNKASAWLLIAIGVLITVLGTYFISIDSGELNTALYGFLTPNVLMVSAGVFMLVTNYKFRFSFSESLRNFLCKHSYGIYLAHILVLTQLNKYGLSWQTINPAAGIFLTTFFCILFSCVLVWGISRLPYGKYVAG